MILIELYSGPLSCTAHKLRKAASICRTNRAPARTSTQPLFLRPSRSSSAPPGVIHVPRYSAHPSLAIHLNLKHFHAHKGFKHGRDKGKDFCLSILFLLTVFHFSSTHCVFNWLCLVILSLVFSHTERLCGDGRLLWPNRTGADSLPYAGSRLPLWGAGSTIRAPCVVRFGNSAWMSWEWGENVHGSPCWMTEMTPAWWAEWIHISGAAHD